MSQALKVLNPHFLRWDPTPRAPIEPLLAEVVASISELEADAGPQRLTITEVTDDIRDLAEELGDMVFDPVRGTTKDDLRTQAITIMVAAARFVRDICTDR